MWDDLSAAEFWSFVATAAAVAAGGAAGLGLPPRSRLRSILIWGWACVPLALATYIYVGSAIHRGYMAGSEFVVLLIFAPVLIPWLGLVAFFYNLVRRLREIHTGVE